MNYEQIVERDGLPASVPTERVVLGQLLSYLPTERPLLEENLLRLSEHLFSLGSHQRIFDAIWHVAKDGGLPDLTTVGRYLDGKKSLESVGGLGYLASLYGGLPLHLDITNYVAILREESQRRSLLATSELFANRAVDRGLDTKGTISDAIRALESIQEEDEKTIVEPVSVFLKHQKIEEIFGTLSREGGLQLGFAQLDELTGGLQGGDLMVVAARPSMGKTGWACNVAHHIAVVQGKTPAFYTLEQKKGPIMGRMLSGSTRIDSAHIKSGNLSDHERDLILQYRQRIADSNLFLIDTPKLTVTDIRAQCRRIKRTHGLDVIIIDQLSKVSRSDVRERNMPKHEQIGEQTTALKHLAQELDVPVIVLNQLTRDSAKHKDPQSEPVLTDLKESGSIEEDADLVLFLHRPEYFDRNDPSLKGKAWQILSKNREGETGKVKGEYNASIQRWIDPTELQPRQQGFSMRQEDEDFFAARMSYQDYGG